MEGYAAKDLKELGHPMPSRKQYSPHPHTPPKYGAKQQFAADPDTSPLLDKNGKRFVQRVTGKFLYLARGVDLTMLTSLSAIASKQSKPTVDTMRKVRQLLDYAATQEEAIITYRASDMVLAAHADASYLSEPNARSRAGGHFFLSSNCQYPANNGAILSIARIIKNVMSSAAEAELGALYIVAQEAMYIRIILEELGHKQPPTPIQTDNSTAEGVVNNKVQPKRTKAMDMRFHWLRDRKLRDMLRFYWRPGTMNLADYFTKHHPAAHHKHIRKEYLTSQSATEQFARGKTTRLCGRGDDGTLVSEQPAQCREGHCQIHQEAD